MGRKAKENTKKKVKSRNLVKRGPHNQYSAKMVHAVFASWLHNGRNQRAAAEQMGISSSTVHRYVLKGAPHYGIPPFAELAEQYPEVADPRAVVNLMVPLDWSWDERQAIRVGLHIAQTLRVRALEALGRLKADNLSFKDISDAIKLASELEKEYVSKAEGFGLVGETGKTGTAMEEKSTEELETLAAKEKATEEPAKEAAESTEEESEAVAGNA